ncbi:MAG: 16S rRNA (uracil1498-N3)-methyltransferase [Paraglaciecola psychrophila]|jgi:16S rRNA (uracil1498-N3)-methyltransferase
MRIPRIYSTQTLALEQALRLEQKPSHHISKVLRLVAGDELDLFDGRGGQYRARIEAVSKKWVEVITTDFDAEDRESPLHIHLGIAISKGDRMDQVMQKATELGVSTITPLYAARSQIKLKGERAEKKVDYWRQITVAACEQCQRNRLPQVQDIAHLSDWVAHCEVQQKFVLHHRSVGQIDQQQAVDSVALLVGPEGGLDSDEIDEAERAGYQSLTLGPRVLRTETAPLAAISLLQHLWGDL